MKRLMGKISKGGPSVPTSQGSTTGGRSSSTGRQGVTHSGMTHHDETDHDLVRRAAINRTSKRSRLPLEGGSRPSPVYLWDSRSATGAGDSRAAGDVLPHRRRSPWPWIIGATLVLAACVVAVVRADKPPILLLEGSRKTISSSITLGALDWAPEMMSAAQESLKAASREIDHQNNRFFVIRDYDLARTRAMNAQEIARAAVPMAVARRDSMRVVVTDRLKLAKEALDSARRAMASVEMSGYNRSKLVQFDIMRRHAMHLAGDGQYRKADLEAQSVIRGAGVILGDIDDQVEDYQKNKVMWANWARETIDWSRRNQAYAIVVRKLDHRCDLYYAGTLKASYAADLGIRWMGYKMRAGDNVTPDGRYLISSKKAGSRYYKALEINYPNAEDRARFARLKAEGKLSKRASIGSLLEIHGHGGRGKDWTSGCVALRNDQIDQLFARVNVGTPVTIVGDWNPGGSFSGEDGKTAR